jgi:pimeloyl-ACP methyl ester carboxylesterase
LTRAIVRREDHPMTVETVESTDGTRIACWRSGEGPPLVFVPGITGDHTHLALVAPLLEPHFSLWMMDRRGRGESGDAPEYAIEREYEDVAAVVDAIGGPVDVFGHSFGGDVLLGAMLVTANLRRAVIYEPGPGDLPNLDAAADELEALVAGDEREAMLEKFFRELVGFTAEQYAEHRASEDFTRNTALAHTVPREVRAINNAWPLDADAYAAIDTPTLLLAGSDSPAGDRRMTDLVQATLPNSRIAVLDGQKHFAMWDDPDLVARVLVDFLLNEDPPARRTP